MSSTCRARAGLPLSPRPAVTGRGSLAWILPLAYFLFVCGEFCLLTSVVLRATAEGHTAFRVGLVGTSLWIGILAATLLAHRVARHIGSVATVVAGLLIALVGMLAAVPQPTLPWIVPAMAVVGLGGGLAWVSGEALVVEAAAPAQRGLVVGVFETGVGFALMLGPALVPLSVQLHLSELWVAAAFALAGWLLSLCLLRVRLNDVQAPGLAQAREPRPGATWALAAVAALGGMMENGVAGLLPSISARLDFSLTHAALLGTVMGAGSALMQPPAGQLADRLGVRGTVLATWGLVLACNLLLLVCASNPQWVLWVVGFGVCGFGGAAYTLVIVELGKRYHGVRLVRAVSASAASYSVGTAIGPAAGGALFDQGGLHLLAGALCAAAALAMVASVVAWRRDAKQLAA